jgi:hypothetical protein
MLVSIDCRTFEHLVFLYDFRSRAEIFISCLYVYIYICIYMAEIKKAYKILVGLLHAKTTL